MSARLTIDFQGEQVQADELEFKAEKEDWGLFMTEDGTAVKLHITAKIYRLVDKHYEDGSPIYVMAGSAAVTFATKTAAEELRMTCPHCHQPLTPEQLRLYGRPGARPSQRK